MQCYLLGSSYLVGRVLSIGLWNSLSDYGSLPFLLPLFFWSVVTFPLIALDRNFIRCW